jgi:hypothetical protein
MRIKEKGTCLHHPIHRRVLPVLDLHSMLRPASLIRTIPAFRQQAFQPHVSRHAGRCATCHYFAASNLKIRSPPVALNANQRIWVRKEINNV